MGWRLRRDRSNDALWRRYTTLLVVLVAQAAIGYTQYFTDVPALLVGFHIAGATALWISVLSFHLGLFAWRPEPVEARRAATVDVPGAKSAVVPS